MRSNTRHESRQKDRQATRLPQPGRKKRDPRELDKLLDKGIEDSMATSDPVEVTQPDVHAGDGRGAENVESGHGKHDGN